MGHEKSLPDGQASSEHLKAPILYYVYTCIIDIIFSGRPTIPPSDVQQLANSETEEGKI